MIAEIILITNIYRSLIGVPVLTENKILDATAHYKACDILEKGYWAHTAPNGQTPWDIMYKYDYKYKVAGENLAKDFTNPQAVMTKWLDSPKHRENIEKKEYTEIGIGECGNIIAVHFGNPLK